EDVLRRGVEAAFVPHRSATIATATRAQAVTSQIQPCALSGSITTALNDADNSQSLSSGDSLSVTFDQCQQSADDTMSGALVFTIGSVTSAPSGDVQFSGSLAFQQVSSTSGTYTAGIHGSVNVSTAITSTSFQLSFTVGSDALTVTAAAPG